MSVYEVIDESIFNADKRSKDERLARMITVEFAVYIQEQQQY